MANKLMGYDNLNPTHKKSLTYMGKVKPNVRQIAIEVLNAVQEAGLSSVTVVWGYNPASVPEHSSGLALDFMVYTDKRLGDFIADYLWTNRKRLGLRWEIWRQRIRSTSPGKPGTWQWMSDRGGVTANHYDHVHCFFKSGPYIPPRGGEDVDGISTVSLGLLLESIELDMPSPNRPRTHLSNTKTVEKALNKEGLLDIEYVDGSAGTASFGPDGAYHQWQYKLGYRGKDADGIPGMDSLTRLGDRHGFKVVY